MKYFVMTHREATEGTLRHLPFYRRLGEVVLLSPIDSPVIIDGYRCEQAGKSFHGFDGAKFSEVNAQMLYRFAAFFDLMLAHAADHYVLCEWDQIFIREPVATADVTCCHLTRFHWQDWANYSHDVFPVVPYVFTRRGLERVAKSCRKYIKAETFECGHSDRWLAAVFHHEQIAWNTLVGGFTSFNVHDFRSQMPFYAGALAAAPVCIHPVKTLDELTWVADMLACIDPRLHAELRELGLWAQSGVQDQNTSNASSMRPGRTLYQGSV